MNLNPETEFEQQDENVGDFPTGQFYIRAVGRTANTELPEKESTSNTSTLPREKSSSSKPQTNEQKGNNNLNKVLLGGLLGATLGTLAAALANRKTAQGANLAAKGVGDAVKSVGEGVNVAAKGVGDAAKTVAEGFNQGLVSPVVDAIKDTAEGAKKTLENTADQLKQTAEYVNPADQEFEPQTTYVLIPVEKERIIERTIIVEPTLPEESGENSTMAEESYQQDRDSYQTSQSNEQTTDYYE